MRMEHIYVHSNSRFAHRCWKFFKKVQKTKRASVSLFGGQVPLCPRMLWAPNSVGEKSSAGTSRSLQQGPGKNMNSASSLLLTWKTENKHIVNLQVIAGKTSWQNRSISDLEGGIKKATLLACFWPKHQHKESILPHTNTSLFLKCYSLWILTFSLTAGISDTALFVTAQQDSEPPYTSQRVLGQALQCTPPSLLGEEKRLCLNSAVTGFISSLCFSWCCRSVH